MKVIDFIKNHANAKKLLTEKPYCISVKEDDDYMLLKYDQINSDFNEEIVRECRGLVIDKHTLEPVALSFYKFFNVQEPLADKIDWNTATVQEKVDGSKLLVWFDTYTRNWRVSTSGMLDARDAKVNDFGTTFYDLFERAVGGKDCVDDFFLTLDVNKCFTFELVSPMSKVVVEYDKTKLYLIGVRDMSTLEEKSPAIYYNRGLGKFCSLPKQYSLHTLSECLSAVQHMGTDQEGFVVVDKDWHRIKIKSPVYVVAHHLKNNGTITRKRVYEIICNGEQDEFLSYFPEYKDYFDEINEAGRQLSNTLVLATSTLHEKKDEPRKVLAEFINTQYKQIAPLLFKFVDLGFDEIKHKNWWFELPQQTQLGYIERFIKEKK